MDQLAAGIGFKGIVEQTFASREWGVPQSWPILLHQRIREPARCIENVTRCCKPVGGHLRRQHPLHCAVAGMERFAHRPEGCRHATSARRRRGQSVQDLVPVEAEQDRRRRRSCKPAEDRRRVEARRLHLVADAAIAPHRCDFVSGDERVQRSRLVQAMPFCQCQHCRPGRRAQMARRMTPSVVEVQGMTHRGVNQRSQRWCGLRAAQDLRPSFCAQRYHRLADSM